MHRAETDFVLEKITRTRQKDLTDKLCHYVVRRPTEFRSADTRNNVVAARIKSSVEILGIPRERYSCRFVFFVGTREFRAGRRYSQCFICDDRGLNNGRDRAPNRTRPPERSDTSRAYVEGEANLVKRTNYNRQNSKTLAFRASLSVYSFFRSSFQHCFNHEPHYIYGPILLFTTHNIIC